jgi:hypothetical protein
MVLNIILADTTYCMQLDSNYSIDFVPKPLEIEGGGVTGGCFGVELDIDNKFSNLGNFEAASVVT